MKTTTRFMVLPILMIGLLYSQGCVVLLGPSLPSFKTAYSETTVKKADHFYTMNKILLLDISGVITKDYESSILERSIQDDPIADIKEALSKAKEDNSVKAVILRIDSPGGMVSWCDMIYREIKQFKEETEKPVISSIMSVGASGGYYIALAADRIYVSPGGITGSIGVIAVFINLEELADKVGVTAQIIKSGDKKDMGSLWRELTSEEREILEGVINEYYGKFLEKVKTNRPAIQESTLEKMTDGRIFTAEQAKQSGFIDGIAYLDEAIEHAKDLADIEDARVVMYYRRFEYKNNIYSAFPGGFPSGLIPNVNLINVDMSRLIPTLGPGFYYLWYPGAAK